MPDRVVAIDGPAGSGKSTTAKAVAERLGFAHLESGALYRAVTLAALTAAAAGESGTLAAAERFGVRLSLAGGEYRPYLGGRDVSEEVRSGRVTARVSEVSAYPGVRRWVNDALRRAAAEHPHGVVMDGRDIGSVVFPEAFVKVFMTASPEARALRRARQDGMAEDEGTLGRLGEDLEARDHADSTRSVAPLVRPPDAVEVDTSRLSFEEQADRVVSLARNRLRQLDIG